MKYQELKVQSAEVIKQIASSRTIHQAAMIRDRFLGESHKAQAEVYKDRSLTPAECLRVIDDFRYLDKSIWNAFHDFVWQPNYDEHPSLEYGYTNN